VVPQSHTGGADYVKVVEDTPILSAAKMQAKEDTPIQYFLQRKCRPKNVVFSDNSMTILAWDHPSESVKRRHPPLVSENLTNTQP